MGWVALGLWAQSSPAQEGRAPGQQGRNRRNFFKPSPPVPTIRQSWTDTVEGQGPDREVAATIALLRAREALEAYLATQTPRIRHMPSEEFISSHLVLKREAKELTESEDHLQKGRNVLRLELQVTDKDYTDMLVLDWEAYEKTKEARIQDRVFILCKIMAGLVASLGAVAGYLRLEEATKGYYTAWLRLAAIGFLGAVGAGLWLVS
jgi:hypothetical protein